MKKKGFTLIELLAVIVILAIIALIAMPLVLNTIEKAKEGAAKASAYAYAEEVERYIILSELDPTLPKLQTGVEYKLSPEKSEVATLADPATTYINDLVSIKGDKPTKGYLKLDSEYKIEKMEMVIKSYPVTCENDECKITGSKVEEEEKEEEKDDTEEIVYGVTSENPNPTTTSGLIKIVYLDPTDLTKKCDESNAVSTTGTKEGCMKWYAYAETDTTYTMILDHNTTATIAWNENNTSNQVPDASFTQKLESDTAKWNKNLNPRIINAVEIAKITSYSNFDILTTSDWFYFDTNNQVQTATTQGSSKYAWLYDYTKDCTSYGCNIADQQTNGYWANSYGIGDGEYIWTVHYGGNLGGVQIFEESVVGIRPVITIDKKIINQSKYVITNIIPDGSFENNGNGWYLGTASDSAYEGEIVTNQFVTGNKSLYIFDDSKTKRNWSTISLSLKPNHKYYLSSFVKYESGNDVGYIGLMYGGSYRDLAYTVNSTHNQWTRLSTVNILQDEDTLQVGTQGYRTASYYIDDIILIDLTETFGSGNEPTKEWCDQNIDWFEGSKNIYK